MPTFAFANSTWQFEVYETGEFEKLEDAVNYAKTMADEMDMDIEVWEEKITIQPFTSYFDGGMMGDEEAVEMRDKCLTKELAQGEAK